MVAASVALALSMAAGGVTLLWQARRSVGIEVAAALASTTQAVRTGLQNAASAPSAASSLPRLVRMFDGNRHVRVTLADASGAVILSSRPDISARPPPAWFVAAIDPHAEAVRVAAPGGGSVLVEPDPVNEIGEVWDGLRDGLLIVGLFSLTALVLISQAVTRALRPLESVSDALGQVGAGDFDVRVTARGSEEIERLAKGFNAMASQLSTVAGENRRLHEQLLTLQEEERAELARDLHDEIGPYLFAVKVDAAAMRGYAAAGELEAISGRVDLIQAAVGHMQTQVSDMLRRLRPLRAVEFGLTPAIEDLIGFWRARRPQIAFDLRVALDDGAMGLSAREVFYRVAQEALSNAVRHGAPSHIRLDVEGGEDGGVVLRVADNGVCEPRTAGRPRFGLVGMRERIGALGGTLTIDRGASGWSVVACLPRHAAVANDLPEAAA